MRNARVVFTAPLEVEVQDTEMPEPGPTQVLVQTELSLISSGTELTVLRGVYPPESNWARYGTFPWLPGYCNVGRVVRTGDGVTKVKVGCRVVSAANHAAFYVAGQDDLYLIPKGVSSADASFTIVAQVVMHGVRSASVVLGENLVVCGLGLLGQVCVALARFAGAWPLIGVDLERFRRESALKLGATRVAAPAEAREVVRESTNGLMADVVIELTGNPEAIPQEILWLRRQGRLVVLSSPRGVTTMDFHDLVNSRGTIIIGAHNWARPSMASEYHRWTQSHDARFYLRLAEAGLISPAGLLTERFPAEKAPEAYARLLDHPDRVIAVGLDWTGLSQ